MVAHTARANSKARGARPFDPTRDLTAVARLLEEAFRSEHTFPLSNTPLLREVGIALWTLSYTPVFPENVTGFVWVEDGSVVGNVTITLEEGRLDRYLISNVAVKTNYRRQGIARALMEIAIEHLRKREAKWALLNVRPQTAPAIQLYRHLRFQEIEMRGEWSSPALQAPPGTNAPLANSMRALSSSDRRAVFDLLQAATPPLVSQFRLPRPTECSPNWDDRLSESMIDFLVGQTTRRWVLHRDLQIMALLILRAQRLASPHRISFQVHPEIRGQVEQDLIEYALGKLAAFPKREIRVGISSTHPELIAAVERRGLRFLNGLTLMALAIS